MSGVLSLVKLGFQPRKRPWSAGPLSCSGSGPHFHRSPISGDPASARLSSQARDSDVVRSRRVARTIDPHCKEVDFRLTSCSS